jgi:hypothetical protein
MTGINRQNVGRVAERVISVMTAKATAGWATHDGEQKFEKNGWSADEKFNETQQLILAQLNVGAYSFCNLHPDTPRILGKGEELTE